MYFLNKAQDFIESFAALKFLAPLLFRLILASVMFWAGWQKVNHIEGTADFFAALSIPMPLVMAWLVGLVELVGGLCLLAGLAVRWWAVPLMATMLVAAVTVHWDNGWYAIAQSRFDGQIVSGSSEPQNVQVRVTRINQAIKKYAKDPAWITDNGRYRVVLLQNGIEFAAIYFAMLLSLFFTGAGTLSLDFLLRSVFRRENNYY